MKESHYKGGIEKEYVFFLLKLNFFGLNDLTWVHK